MFFDSLLYDAISESNKSCNQMAIETKSRYGVDISKQGIDQRFSVGAQKYIQTLISEVLSTQISQSIDIGLLELFQRVIIKDSSKFDLNARLKDKLPGFGGSASEAGVCIQYEFDIKTGQVNDLAITPANRPDTKDALSTVDLVKKGDLTIRDLGYFAVEFFKATQKEGAFFLSRLNAKIIVYQKKEEKFEELDFGKLYETMREDNTEKIDIDVFIGQDYKFPVRLIVELTSDGVFNTRMKKIGEYNKKKGFQTSQNYRNRSRFNLFVTNIPTNIVAGGAIAKLYKIRWQIELIFKIWKSVFGLDNIAPMKYERLMSTLNARLLIVLINWETFMVQRANLFEKVGHLLSINKCFKTLKDNSAQLRYILENGGKGIERWMRWTTGIFESKHWLEKRKNKLGFEEIIYLNIL
jgi:hypothetical protein